MALANDFTTLLDAIQRSPARLTPRCRSPPAQADPPADTGPLSLPAQPSTTPSRPGSRARENQLQTPSAIPRVPAGTRPHPKSRPSSPAAPQIGGFRLTLAEREQGAVRPVHQRLLFGPTRAAAKLSRWSTRNTVGICRARLEHRGPFAEVDVRVANHRGWGTRQVGAALCLLVVDPSGSRAWRWRGKRAR